MAQGNNLYYRGMVDLASIVIAVGWVGLWFLWPSAATSKPGMPSIPAPRTFLVQMPMIDKAYASQDHFRKPSDPSVMSDEPGAILERLTSPLQRAPRYLDAPSAGSVASVAMIDDVVPADLGQYRPIWNGERKPIERKADRDMRMMSRLDSRLAENKYTPPVFSVDELKRFDKPWQVVMYVEVNEDGHVENVLLESGSEDQAVNADVIKAVYRSKGGQPEAAYGGRLTLSYGRP